MLLTAREPLPSAWSVVFATSWLIAAMSRVVRAPRRSRRTTAQALQQLPMRRGAQSILAAARRGRCPSSPQDRCLPPSPPASATAHARRAAHGPAAAAASVFEEAALPPLPPPPPQPASPAWRAAAALLGGGAAATLGGLAYLASSACLVPARSSRAALASSRLTPLLGPSPRRGRHAGTAGSRRARADAGGGHGVGGAGGKRCGGAPGGAHRCCGLHQPLRGAQRPEAAAGPAAGDSQLHAHAGFVPAWACSCLG